MGKFSFQKGFGQLQLKDVPVVKREIMNALNINTRSSWGARLKGEIEPKISEAQAIEKIFADYGITEIWGTDENKSDINGA